MAAPHPLLLQEALHTAPQARGQQGVKGRRVGGQGEA